MKEIYRTSDLIELSWLQAVLSDRKIDSIVLDDHVSSFYAGALIPRRLMVSDEDYEPAMRHVENALKNGEDAIPPHQDQG